MQSVKDYYFTNWAESYSCRPETYFEPGTENELRQILTEANEKGKKVRIVGAGLSPSDLCCTDGFMICMKKFNKVLQIDKTKCTVFVEGGVIIGDLVDTLKKEGLALNMMPCIRNLSLAGMVSTGSHNTGINYPITSAYVLQIDVMKADGGVISCNADDNSDLFYSLACSLGSLGVILRLTVQCTPFYHLELTNESLQFNTVIESIDKIAHSSDHTRMFYIPYHDKITVQKMNRIKPSESIYHPHSWFWDDFVGFFLLQFLYFISLSYQPLVKVINKLYQRLLYNQPYKIVDSYENVFTFDVKFRQYVSEWSIPVENTGLALARLKDLVENSDFPAHLPVEIRFVREDRIFLSSAYGRNSTYINALSYRPYGKEPPKHRLYFKKFGEIMNALDGRPHLAKDHPFERKDMNRVYPKFAEFCSIRKNVDPNDIFANKYIERVIGTN